jgi:hypothetical protein
LRYVEIEITGQHPVEPTFDATIFAYIEDTTVISETRVDNPIALVVSRSPVRQYGTRESRIQMNFDPRTKTLRSRRAESFGIVASKGIHREFPFDTAGFDFGIAFTPKVPFSWVRIVNRVPGFVMECKTLEVKRSRDTSLNLSFVLRRSPLTQLASIVLSIASIVFFIFIIRLNDVRALASSVSTYFFSMWAIRKVLESEMHVYPTLLDCFILTMCMGLLAALCGKAALTGARAERIALTPKAKEAASTDS